MNPSCTSPPENGYQSFLLRCWPGEQDAPGSDVAWRFVLEEVAHPGNRQGFSQVEALLTFLRATLEQPPLAEIAKEGCL